MALNTRSQFPLHKQKDIPYLPRPLLLSGVSFTETEKNINNSFFKCVIVNKNSYLPLSCQKRMYLWYFRPCPYSQGDNFKDIINFTLPHIEDTVSSTPEWYGTKDAPRISFCRNKCPLKPPLNPTAAVPFPSTRLLLFQSTCFLNVRCVSPAHSAPLHSTSGSSRSVHSEWISSHILFHGKDRNLNSLSF